MGGKKGGKSKREKGRPKVHQSYTVVNQSYEDKEYETKPKPVLVPTKTLENRRKKKDLGPVMRFGDGIPEDYRAKRNMLMQDDTAEEHMFDEEVEEDFDQDFIHQMMRAPPPDADDDADKDLEDKEYPHHDTTKRAIDKAFEREMDEFDLDEDLDEEDPRAHGTMDVMAYSTHLQQFVSEHAGDSYFSELPQKHHALLKHLRFHADNNAIFDSNAQGYFMTVLPNKRDGMRVAEQFHKDSLAMKDITLQAVQSGKLVVKDALEEDDTKLEGEEAAKLAEIPRRKDERHDCETILSTYSTLYNHPNIIAAAKKKLDLQRAVRNKPQKHKTVASAAGDSEQQPHHDKRQRGADSMTNDQDNTATATPAGVASANSNKKHVHEEQAQATAKRKLTQANDSSGSDSGDDEENEVDDNGIVQYVDPAMLSHRDKNETPEERRMRRRMIKEYQRERRSQKKMLKEEYKAMHIERTNVAPKSKKEKTQMNLSVVRPT